MWSLPSFASESSTNAHFLSLVIHLHDSAMHNTRWLSNLESESTKTLIIWPDRASSFDTSDPMRNAVLTPASGPNSVSSTYFRSYHAPAILSGKLNRSTIWREATVTVDSQIWHLLRPTGLTGRADRSDRSDLCSPSRIRVFVKSPHVILLMKGYVFPSL